MHKVVIAPDSFKGVLSAREVCDIISYKINRHYPFCQIVKVPVADGGEGSIEAFLCAKNGKKIFCDVKGANGETLNCYFGIFEKTAVVEVAQAVGLSLPTRAPALSGTTYGVGQLIGQAVKMGVEKILLCLGGTSTVDAGCGMAAALGAKFYDKEFREFLPVGKNLCEIRSVDFSAMRRLLGLVRINVLYDVDCKLCGDEEISLNEAVYLSEKATGDRNRALAYYLKASGILEGNVEECLDFYFKMCSVNVTAVDIAQMSAVLANHGACPVTQEELIPRESAKEVRALMLTCGMYDGSGEFAMTVGFPAKSGVGGGIAAALVDHMGIGVFGPSLDEKGNSVGGIKILEHLSKNLDFNLF